ncbi:hypothetical protein ACFS4T_16390 [Pseudomonas lini]
MREKVQKNWIEATGQNAQAPAGLVEAERAEWDRLQVVKTGLTRKGSTKKVAADPIRRHLLWEPEQFEPQPVDRLVKDGFPLREVSTLAASGTPLKWFSLLNLKGAPKLLEEDLKKRSARARKKFLKASQRTVTVVQVKKQRAEGIWPVAGKPGRTKKIGDQAGDWFDTNGWFNIDKFYSFLQTNGYKVTQLEDAGARKRMGRAP